MRRSRADTIATLTAVRLHPRAMTKSLFLAALVGGALTLAASAMTAPQPRAGRRLSTVIVSAGALDRTNTIVRFALPPGTRGEHLQLRILDDDRQDVPPRDRQDTVSLQISRDRQASFILPSLRAGETRRYQLEPALAVTDATPLVQAREERQGVGIGLDWTPVLRYQAEKGELPDETLKPILRRGGYIHPVRTPRGRVVTDDYPPGQPHHHGIWAAWTRTAFQGRAPDFWNMADGTGTVEFENLLETWSGHTHAGFSARHRYVDLGATPPVTVLTEVWTVSVYGIAGAPAPYRMFDIDIRQDLATASPLGLPPYHYGGLGVRGRREWAEAGGARFLTSEGKDRASANATRARWCYIGGLVDGALAGLVILGHPSNERAPQPVRVHPTEPYFTFAPQQAGRMELTPGQPYVMKYRVLAIDGPPDKTLIDRVWQDYADPVSVRIE